MSKTKFQPLGNLVLVLPTARKETTEHGLYIPETAADRPNQGTIVAAGEGVRSDKGELYPMKVKVGDTVIFPRFAGTELMLDKTKYLVLRETDIFGIVSE